MPGLGQPLTATPEDQDEAAATLPVDLGTRLGQEIAPFGPNSMSSRAQTWLEGMDPAGAAGREVAYGQTGDSRFLDPATMPDKLPSEDANERYGVDGYLRFNGPVEENDAAQQSAMAEEKRFNDQVLARSNPSPLLDFGAGVAGGLVDPLGLSVMFGTGGLGDALLGGDALVDGGMAITRLGRLANIASNLPRTLGIGALNNAGYVAASAGLASASGDDYGFGDALRDLAAGAILHTTVHATLRAAGELGRAVNPDGLRAPGSLEEARAQLAALNGDLAVSGAPDASGDMGNPITEQLQPRSRADLMNSAAPGAYTPYVPPEVDALPAQARMGAWAMALDQVASDRPVDVGQYVARELAPPGLDRLNETDALSDLPSFRPVAAPGGEAPEAMAVTTRGTEVPVRYGLAELGALTTSHTDDLETNPAFPPELQPRDRGRAGAQARNLILERDLNPKLLMSDVGAGQGAPIVSPAGVVESGNGRTIALRRAAAKGSPAYDAYKTALTAAGYDVSGMKDPVLVRMRTQPMTGAQRSGLAREMNADVTERMSAGEQAMADAKAMPDDIFDHIEEGRGPTTSRAFARAFIDRVAPDQVGAMTDADGRLSPDGARRIKAAILAKAYGDPRLVGQIFEGEDTPARKIGEGLAEAAPAWARLRALVARGEAPKVLDLTPALQSAMDLVRFAAGEGRKLAEVLGERLGQGEMFGAGGVSPFTEALLRLMFRDEGFTRPLAGDKIAWALKDYARQASAVEPGPDLFGAIPDESTARAILANVADRFQRGDAGDLDVRAPGKSDGAAQPAADAVVDLRPARGAGEGAPGELPHQGEPAPGDAGRLRADANDAGRAGEPAAEVGGAARPRGPTGQQLIAGDAELKAIADDTGRLEAENGLETEIPENQQPDTVAEAIRAAAVCLGEEGL